MKTQKKLLYLFVVFIVLFSLVFFYENSTSDKRRKQAYLNSYRIEENLEGSEFKIINPIGEILLKQQEEEWVVESANQEKKADESVVTQLIESITTLPKGELISTNANNLGKYELENPAIRLQIIKNEEEILTVYFSNKGTSPQNNYLRQDDDKRVFVVSSPLVQLLGKSFDQWRDNTLFTFSMDEIESFSLRKGDKKWTFLMENQEQVSVKEFKNDQLETEKLLTQGKELNDYNDYLDTILKSKGQGFVSNESFEDLEEVAARLSFQLKNGVEYGVLIKKDSEGSFLAQTSNETDIFRISSNLFTHIEPLFLNSLDNTDQDKNNETSNPDL